MLTRLSDTLESFDSDPAVLDKAKRLIAELQRQLGEYGSFQANR